MYSMYMICIYNIMYIWYIYIYMYTDITILQPIAPPVHSS